MKYFIAYRHTGENPERLDALLTPIKQAFERRGDEIYCTFFNDTSFRARGLGPHEIMYEAFQKIEEMGRLFVLLDSVDKSEGMLMEIGYCIAKKIPITIAYNRAITDSYVPHMVSSTIAYSDIDELVASIDRMVV